MEKLEKKYNANNKNKPRIKKNRCIPTPLYRTQFVPTEFEYMIYVCFAD